MMRSTLTRRPSGSNPRWQVRVTTGGTGHSGALGDKAETGRLLGSRWRPDWQYNTAPSLVEQAPMGALDCQLRVGDAQADGSHCRAVVLGQDCVSSALAYPMAVALVFHTNGCTIDLPLEQSFELQPMDSTRALVCPSFGGFIGCGRWRFPLGRVAW